MKAIFAIAALLISFGASASYDFGINRPGGDYHNFEMADPNSFHCYAACVNDSRCVAWTYVHPGVQGRFARCWLKNTIPAKHGSSCCISGAKDHERYKSRWQQIHGGSWTNGWQFNHPGPICGAFATGCQCGSENYCGVVSNGSVVKYWANGCHKPPMHLKCISEAY